MAWQQIHNRACIHRRRRLCASIGTYPSRSRRDVQPGALSASDSDGATPNGTSGGGTTIVFTVVQYKIHNQALEPPAHAAMQAAFC